MTMSTNDISVEQLTHAIAPIINRALQRNLTIHLSIDNDQTPLTVTYERADTKHPIDKSYGVRACVVKGADTIHPAGITPCITLYHLIAAHADLVK
ncbi:MAG: hypothetical protein ACO3O3_08665 [Ilumatobacteraceae bacterium]